MQAAEIHTQKSRVPVLSGIGKYFKENMGILIAFVIICAIISMLSPVFFTVDNAGFGDDPSDYFGRH